MNTVSAGKLDQSDRNLDICLNDHLMTKVTHPEKHRDIIEFLEWSLRRTGWSLAAGGCSVFLKLPSVSCSDF